MINASNNRNLPNRRSIRYEGYDYSSDGAYFITLVTHHKEHLFGSVVNRVMHLNEFGRIVREEWFRTQELRTNIELAEDEFVIMPNHIHGIIWITEPLKETTANDYGTGDLQVARTRSSNPINSTNPKRPKGPTSNSIGAIIAGFKAAATKRINIARCSFGQPLWLRNYYEHIIETEREYNNIANYIHDNPVNWGTKDEYFT